MASYVNGRRQFLILLFILLFIFACATYSINLYLQWIVLASGVAVLLIVDFMFLSDDTFVYDPSYKSWAIKTGQQL